MPFCPKESAKHHSGRQAYFACKGQFVGADTAQQECDLARDTISKMQYEGEPRNWGWNSHYTKFHSQVLTIEDHTANNLATAMSEADKISAFLKTISADHKNGQLVIAKVIIDGDRSQYPPCLAM